MPLEAFFYIYFTSVEKHVNWSLNLTRNGPHQEINEVEPVNRIDWFVHGYLMNWFNPASAAKKKTHLAQPITLNIHSTSVWAWIYVLPQSRNQCLVTNGDGQTDGQRPHLCSVYSGLCRHVLPWLCASCAYAQAIEEKPATHSYICSACPSITFLPAAPS